MAIERIKWNIKAFKALRRSPEVMSDLIARGSKVADAAGPGFEISPVTGKNRGRVSVRTATAEAREENARTNSLVRAIDAGR